MKTKTFSVLMATKNFRLALVILPTILAGYAAPANAAPITEEVKQRVQADLHGKCLEAFLDGIKRPHFESNTFVFAVGELKSQQYCSWASKTFWRSLEATEIAVIASCETRRPQGGTPCEVYARNNDIVYVGIHDRLKAAKKLFESGDIPAAEHAFNDIKVRSLSALSDEKKGEYEYLFGKVLANSKNWQDRAEAVDYFNHSWYVYKNVNAAVEEGNLRMAAGDIDRNWNWQSIRDAYQYFLANASEEQKSLHPEVEQNLRQTEPYYQADLAQREAAAKELALLDAFRKKELEEQAWPGLHHLRKIDAIKAEREAKQQEEIRLAEEKRIAKEGDGSPVDLTCKSYGAKPGSEGYINCRTQLARTRQLADEQDTAQRNRESAEQKAKFVADFNSNKRCAEETQNSACFNNAGVALFNLGDKNGAKDWITVAARYGDPTAISNLSKNGLPVPEPDLLRKQQEAKSSDNVGTALMLLLGGFNAYQQGRVAGYQSVPTPIYIPAPKPTPAPALAPIPQMAPDGSYVPGGGRITMCPDGSYVSGNCVMAPDGKYVGQ